MKKIIILFVLMLFITSCNNVAIKSTSYEYNHQCIKKCRELNLELDSVISEGDNVYCECIRIEKLK